MKYALYFLGSIVAIYSTVFVVNTVVNLVSNGQNYVYDETNGLVWLKCDYGLAGKDCDIPNYCGFDGTSQDANAIKLEDNPICLPERDYGKTIQVGTTPVFSNRRYVDSDDSGVAVCSNGVLCKDGAFIVAEILHEDYSSTDQQFVKVPNTEKDKACENHGGIATFGAEKIYDWELPEIKELETLYDEDEGIDSKLFPNASKKFLSIDQGIGDVPNRYKTVVFLPKNEIDIDDTDITAPVKCVFRVEPISVENNEMYYLDPEGFETEKKELICARSLPRSLSFELKYDGEYAGIKKELKYYEDLEKIYFYMNTTASFVKKHYTLMIFDKKTETEVFYKDNNHFWFDEDYKIYRGEAGITSGTEIYKRIISNINPHLNMTKKPLEEWRGEETYIQPANYFTKNSEDIFSSDFIYSLKNDDNFSKLFLSNIHYGEVVGLESENTNDLDKEYCIGLSSFNDYDSSKINIKENSVTYEEMIKLRDDFENQYVNSRHIRFNKESKEQDCTNSDSNPIVGKIFFCDSIGEIWYRLPTKEVCEKEKERSPDCTSKYCYYNRSCVFEKYGRYN